MDRVEHLTLCENCYKRNMDLPWGISCNLYGDIPDFTSQCSDYEFSEKTKIQSEKIKARSAKRRTTLESQVGKGRNSTLIPIILAIGGFVKTAMRGFDDFFGFLFFFIGIAWLIVVIAGGHKDVEEDEN
jgi:hypothetical protein